LEETRNNHEIEMKEIKEEALECRIDLEAKIDEKEKNTEKMIINIQKKKEEELIKESKDRQKKKEEMNKNILKQMEKLEENNKKFFEKQEKIEQNILIKNVEKKKYN